MKRASQVALVVKNLPANAEDIRHRFNPWVGKIPWRRAPQPTPVFLPGESPRTGAKEPTVHVVDKNQARLKRLSMHIFHGSFSPLYLTEVLIHD